MPLGVLAGGALGEAFGVRVALIAGMFGMLATSLPLLLSPIRTEKPRPGA